MDDVAAAQDLQAGGEVAHEAARLGFTQRRPRLAVLAQVHLAELEDQEDVRLRVERLDELDNVRVRHGLHHADLALDVGLLPLVQNPVHAAEAIPVDQLERHLVAALALGWHHRRLVNHAVLALPKPLLQAVPPDRIAEVLVAGCHACAAAVKPALRTFCALSLAFRALNTGRRRDIWERGGRIRAPMLRRACLWGRRREHRRARRYRGLAVR